MRKAVIRANRKVHSDKNKAPKVIRGRTSRHSPPAEATPKRKPPEIGLRVVGREIGLFDGDDGVLETDLPPPTTENSETEVDAGVMARRMFG